VTEALRPKYGKLYGYDASMPANVELAIRLTGSYDDVGAAAVIRHCRVGEYPVATSRRVRRVGRSPRFDEIRAIDHEEHQRGPNADPRKYVAREARPAPAPTQAASTGEAWGIRPRTSSSKENCHG
jgi:hypothetical protein